MLVKQGCTVLYPASNSYCSVLTLGARILFFIFIIKLRCCFYLFGLKSSMIVKLTQRIRDTRE